MAVGRIDPARLEGDALTRWYLRSSADIEEERRQGAEQAYNAFFGQSGETPSDPPPSGDGGNATSADLTPRTWTQVGPNRWRSDAGVVDRQTAGQEHSSYDASTAPLPTFQLAANPARRECVEQCSHLLERPQPPGSDRNQWDFHRCVNQCMSERRPTPRMPPSPTQAAPPKPIPWWMFIPRLIPPVPAIA